MSSGVDLSFLSQEFLASISSASAAEQRALLGSVLDNQDEAAARKLLTYFVQGGSAAFAPDVWELNRPGF